MSFRTKIANRIAGKAASDFDKAPGFDAFWSMLGNTKSTGEIGWKEYGKQLKEYKGTPYACIRKIAPAVAATPLHLFIPQTGSTNGSKRIPVSDEMKAFLSEVTFCKMTLTVSENVEEITDHPALDVFKRANGSMTRSQLFDRTMIVMELNGNSYWNPVLNKTGAIPAQINMLPQDRMEPIVNNGQVTGYKLKRGFTKPDKKYSLEEIIHFFYPNPHSISQGYSPISAASQRVSGERLTSTFQNSTLANMGIPAAIVKIARQMSPEAFTEFKRAFDDLYGGVMKANKLGFTQGEWEIETLGQTLQEMGYIDGAKMLREFIANDFQVPLSKLTMENSNRAVAQAGNAEFQRDTILPKLTMVAEELTQSLIPLFPSLKDTGAFYMFDNPVPEDMRSKMLMRRINRTTNVTTPNDERLADGMDLHPSEAADELAIVRGPMPEQSAEAVERMAKEAIDRSVDNKIDDMRNGDCGHDHGG